MGGHASTGAAVRALVVFHRLALDLSRDAEVSLGPSLTADLDLRVARLVQQDGGISSSALVEQLDLPRSTLARALARVRDEGLVERANDPLDARRAQWRLTRLGQQKLDEYVAAIAETFRGHLAAVEQVLRSHERVPDGPIDGFARAEFDVADALRSAGAAMDREVTRTTPAVGLAAAVDRAALLAVADRGSARPGELAGDSGLAPAGVTSLVDRLVRHGLVVRERGLDSDGRAVVITLTPAGQRAVEAMVDAFRRHEPVLVDALAATLTLGSTIPEDGWGSRLRDERPLLR